MENFTPVGLTVRDIQSGGLLHPQVYERPDDLVDCCLASVIAQRDKVAKYKLACPWAASRKES